MTTLNKKLSKRRPKPIDIYGAEITFGGIKQELLIALSCTVGEDYLADTVTWEIITTSDLQLGDIGEVVVLWPDDRTDGNMPRAKVERIDRDATMDHPIRTRICVRRIK